MIKNFSANEPFRFYFEPGVHTVRLEFVDQPLAINSISLVPAVIIPDYAQVLAEYRQKGYKEASNEATFIFEAELHALEKSDPTIRRESSGDPLASPAQPDS